MIVLEDEESGRMAAEIIEQNREQIAALCRKHRIRALRLFGSAVTDAWDPGASGLAYLVDLGEYSDDSAARFFDLRRELERVTGRRIDLVSAGGLGKG